MAVGDGVLPALAAVSGVRLAVASAGIKVAGRMDVVLLELAPGSEVAAVFTTNAFCAAPVIVAKRHLALARPRLLLVNTGNANAGTGEPGIADAAACCAAVAAQAGVDVAQVLPFSTGVIGQSLPVQKILGVLPDAMAGLVEDGWAAAARAILTTDTRPKGATRQLAVAGGKVTVTGIAKGAGMIKPNMATMLAYVATDARVKRADLQTLLQSAVDCSFNRITIDGDTSTNDAAVLAATGTGIELAPGAAGWEDFARAVTEVCQELAQAIVADGEGATRFIAVRVSGGIEPRECLAVAYAVAESPLVKTACYAADANWGRILAAIGRAGLVDLDIDRVRLSINDVLIASAGGRAPSYTEEAGTAAMQQDTLRVDIELGRGDAVETVWTTDLSHEYIRINAEYRS